MRKLAVVAMLSLVGCVSDPNDPKTWIKKLDDIRESKDAVRTLVKLKDKQAVPPLIELYKKTHDPEHLKAIASFADPASVPVLVDALDYSEESFDAASIAATALGEIGDKSATDGLIKALLKPLPIKTRANVVKLESMKSLAKIKDPKAVDALIKVLQTPADEQDFFLNKSAAKALGAFGDPKAVPALIRGLFMIGRGANIFQECRSGLLNIGEPAVDPLVAAMQHKNLDLELDAKKYQFIPGIIVQKTAMVLGDLRKVKAIVPMMEELKKEDEGIKAGEGKGVSGHREILSALGRIGDPAVKATLEAVAKDPKAPKQKRLGSFDGLWALGDASETALLLPIAKTSFIGKDNMIDGAVAEIAMYAATAYSRLVGADGVAEIQKVPDEILDAHEAFTVAQARVDVAKECKADTACYEKFLAVETGTLNGSAKSLATGKAEKAALMLMQLGKEKGLPALLKHVNAPDAGARLMVLFAIARIGDKSAIPALDKQIEDDEHKPPLLPLVHEMRAVRSLINR